MQANLRRTSRGASVQESAIRIGFADDVPERVKMFLQESLRRSLVQSRLTPESTSNSRWRLPIRSTDVYRSRLPRSIGNGNQCASLVSLTLRLCGRIEVHLDRSFVIGMDRHALQTQFPPSRIELWNAPQLRLPSLHSVLITSAARNPMDTIATTINGHMPQPERNIPI